jgi:hypothetical protein
MRRVSRAVRPRLARFALLALAAVHVPLSGCSTRVPLRAGARPAEGADVRVRFAAPRALRLGMPAGDTVALGGVREVTGRVLAARGDTLEVRVEALAPAVPGIRDSRGRVVLGGGDRLAVRRGSATQTVALGLAAAVGLVVLVVSTVTIPPMR